MEHKPESSPNTFKKLQCKLNTVTNVVPDFNIHTHKHFIVFSMDGERHQTSNGFIQRIFATNRATEKV